MKKAICILLLCQLFILGCYKNLPIYRVVDGTLTDGCYVYEPFMDDFGWRFQTEAQKPIGQDNAGNIIFETQDYGKHLERPIGKREGGNLIDGFENDPQRVFIQERAGFGASMNYRIRKRKDVSIPTVADADISAQDWVVVSIHGRAMAVTDQNTVDAMTDQHLHARSIEKVTGMSPRQIGSSPTFSVTFQ